MKPCRLLLMLSLLISAASQADAPGKISDISGLKDDPGSAVLPAVLPKAQGYASNLSHLDPRLPEDLALSRGSLRRGDASNLGRPCCQEIVILMMVVVFGILFKQIPCLNSVDGVSSPGKNMWHALIVRLATGGS
jgi:hypothetical protein